MPVLGAVVLIDTVSINNGVEGLRFSDTGLKLQALSAGRPDHVKVTVPVKPTIGDTRMPALLVVPREFRIYPPPVLLLTVKSGIAINGGLVEPA